MWTTVPSAVSAGRPIAARRPSRPAHPGDQGTLPVCRPGSVAVETAAAGSSAAGAAAVRRAAAASAARRMPVRRSSGSEEARSPVAACAVPEAEEQDALPPAEREPAVRERDLLGARAEQREEQPLAVALGSRHEPVEHLLDVGEEAGLALVDADAAGSPPAA